MRKQILRRSDDAKRFAIFLCHCQEECMNANKFSLVFFCILSLLCSTPPLINSFIMNFFPKKNHITASLGFMFFKDMSPRICTVYLDIFCMYVNKCCFDAMFFLTRKFQSLRVFSLFFSPREGSRRCHDG